MAHSKAVQAAAGRTYNDSYILVAIYSAVKRVAESGLQGERSVLFVCPTIKGCISDNGITVCNSKPGKYTIDSSSVHHKVQLMHRS